MDYTMVRRIAVVGVLALLAGACSDSPTSPSTPSTGGTGGTTATVTSVTITGSLSVSEGGTSQLVATANLSDGTSQDVSSQSVWVSTDTTVATVSATGLVTALKTGSTDISATHRSQTGKVTLQVAAATYRLTVSGMSVTALNTCDDFTQGLTNGEFAIRARAITPSGAQTTLATTTGYPGSTTSPRGLNLAKNQARSVGSSRTFTLNGASGQSLRIQFSATEWDEQIVIFPPSIRWIHDSRMSDRSSTRTHSFTSGNFSSLGPNSITIGSSGSCGIRLNYTISAVKQ